VYPVKLFFSTYTVLIEMLKTEANLEGRKTYA